MWNEIFGGQWPWQSFAGQQANLQAIAGQNAYAAIQSGTYTGYVQQAMDRYRRAPNVSQHWLDAMLDIELGLFQP
jgi:hypothetical protein